MSKRFVPTWANGAATNISDPMWIKMEADDGSLQSLGPSNDDIPVDEIELAIRARSDSDLRYDNEGAFDWDVNRPIAEQWPWSGEAYSLPVLTDTQAAAVIEQSSHSFEPRLCAALTSLPVVEPSVGWQDRVHAACDEVDRKFAAEDSAALEPWSDGAETKLTDDELVKRVAHAPPGSVRQ